MPRFDRLALRPDVHLGLRIAHFWRAEVESLDWLGMEIDFHRGFFARLNRFLENDRQVLRSRRGSFDRMRRADIEDIDIDRVELQFRQRFRDRLKDNGHRP